MQFYARHAAGYLLVGSTGKFCEPIRNRKLYERTRCQIEQRSSGFAAGAPLVSARAGCAKAHSAHDRPTRRRYQKRRTARLSWKCAEDDRRNRVAHRPDHPSQRQPLSDITTASRYINKNLHCLGHVRMAWIESPNSHMDCHMVKTSKKLARFECGQSD